MHHPRDTVMGIAADEIVLAADEGPSKSSSSSSSSSSSIASSSGGGSSSSGGGGISTDALLEGLAAARRLERAQAAIAAASARLRSGPAFARAVRSFPAGTAVHVGGIDGALPCYGSTEEWAALVKGGRELVADVVGRRTTHMLLFPRLLAPEDRPLCYRAVIRSVFSQEARRQTDFVKVSRCRCRCRCLYVADGMAMHGLVGRHLLPLTPALPCLALLLLCCCCFAFCTGLLQVGRAAPLHPDDAGDRGRGGRLGAHLRARAHAHVQVGASGWGPSTNTSMTPIRRRMHP